MTLGVYWVLRESGLKVKRPKSKDRNGGNRGTLKGKSVLQALVSCASDSWCIIYTQPTVVAVQSLSCVWLSVTSWTAAHQASLSFIISWSLRKLMSIKSVMPSNYLILCHPLLLLPSVFLSIRIFPSESALCIMWPKYWSLSLSSVLSMNIQCWFPLGLTSLVSLLSKGLSRVLSSKLYYFLYNIFL